MKEQKKITLPKYCDNPMKLCLHPQLSQRCWGHSHSIPYTSTHTDPHISPQLPNPTTVYPSFLHKGTNPAALTQPIGQEDRGRVLRGDAEKEDEEDQKGQAVAARCLHVAQDDLGAQLSLVHFLCCNQLACCFGCTFYCSTSL